MSDELSRYPDITEEADYIATQRALVSQPHLRDIVLDHARWCVEFHEPRGRRDKFLYGFTALSAAGFALALMAAVTTANAPWILRAVIVVVPAAVCIGTAHSANEVSRRMSRHRTIADAWRRFIEEA